MTKARQALAASGGSNPYVLPLPVRTGRAPTSSDDNFSTGQLWVNTATNDIYTFDQSAGWLIGGVGTATTTSLGSVTVTDNNMPVATQVYVDAQIAAVVVGAVPAATEITAGIAELATVAETQAYTDDTRIVTPLKLASAFAVPPTLGLGSTTPSPVAATNLSATGVGTGNILTSDTASNFSTTGAGIDVTIDSAAGRVIINGEEAAANAITLLTAAGGIDADAALQINIASSQNAVDAIRIVASAGGIDIDAVGAATEDINITNTGGSVVIAATENAADSIVINSTAGGIDITAAGAAGEDIDITNTAGSIRLTSGEAVSDSMVFASSGGIDADAAGQVNIASSQNAADSIVITSSVGGIDITAAGASAGEDIDITATGSSVNIIATENVADSIVISSSNGGIDIIAASAVAGEDIDITATGSSVNVTATEDVAAAIYLRANGGTSETVKIHADQGTGAASLDLLSDVGGITLTAGLATADAINLVTSAAGGGIDIDAGTAGIDILTTGALSIDCAGTTNYTTTGAFDMTIQSTAGTVIISASEDAADAVQVLSTAGGIDILATGAAAQDIDIVNTGGSVNVTATEDVAEAIYIRANGGTSETIRLHADQGTGVASINIGSDVGGITIAGGVGSADAVNITASTAGGGIDIDSSTGGVIVDTTGAISLDSALASNLTVTGAADLTVNSTAGALILTSGEANADSVVITSGGGMDITATGAAGKDIDVVCTSGSMNVTIGENVSDALVINCSGAASGISIDCGTLGITFGTGIKVAVTSVATAVTPYAVLGTDYFISTDSAGGALEITLPAAPDTGRTLIVYDGTGQAAIGGNVTINGNGKNIAAGGTSAATKLINTAYESYTLTYNGTLWLGQNIV